MITYKKISHGKVFKLLIAVMALFSLKVVAADPIAYINDMGVGKIVEMDTATNTETGAVYDYDGRLLGVRPDGNHLYVLNYGGLIVLDTVSKQEVTTISGVRPTSLAIHPTSGLMYLARWNTNTIEVIDTVTYAVTATIPISIDQEPRVVRVELSPVTNRLYVTSGPYNGANITTIDTQTNTVIETVPMPTGSREQDFAIDPTGDTLYFLSGGQLMAVDTSTMSPTQTITLDRFGHEIEIDSSGGEIYVRNTLGVSIIDTSTMIVTDTVVVKDSTNYMHDMAIHPNGELAYVVGFTWGTGALQGTVVIVDLTSASITDTLAFGSMFGSIAFGPRPETVGGTVTGMIPSSIECHNNNTGQVISIPPAVEPSWDCEAAGLTVHSGDSISISVTGPAK